MIENDKDEPQTVAGPLHEIEEAIRAEAGKPVQSKLELLQRSKASSTIRLLTVIYDCRFWLVPILQWIIFFVIRFGDIGFDKPGRYGLDFDALFYLAIIYLCLLLFGTIRGASSKQPGVVVIIWISTIANMFLLAGKV